MSRYVLAAAVAALIVASACSGGGPVSTAQPTVATSTVPPSSPPSVTAAPTGVVTTQPPATATLTATDSPPPSDSPPTDEPQQTFQGTTGLETLIPDQVGDITLAVGMSYSGQEYIDAATGGSPAAVQAMNDFLAGLGRSVDDISAVGASGFGSGSDYVYITATRVAGADPDALLSTMLQFALDSIPLFNSAMSGVAAPVTIGGKETTLVTTTYGDSVYATDYYYGYGDIVFKVSGDSEDTVAAALSLLP